MNLRLRKENQHCSNHWSFHEIAFVFELYEVLNELHIGSGCIAAVNNLLCDVPTVDLSQDRTALSGKFPEDELKASRELELQNMLNFDAFELVDDLPPRKHA